MIIHVDTEDEYGCKSCPFNTLYSKPTTHRKCSLTQTVISIDEIHAMIRGATLINCPRSHDMSFDDLLCLIKGRFC